MRAKISPQSLPTREACGRSGIVPIPIQIQFCLCHDLLFQYVNSFFRHPESRILLVLRVSYCALACDVAGSTRGYWLSLTSYSLRKMWPIHPNLVQTVLSGAIPWWPVLSFLQQSFGQFCHIQTYEMLTRRNVSGETSLLARLVRCLETF